MGSFELTLVVKGLEVLAYGDQRRPEPSCQIAHQDSAVGPQNFQNFSPALLA